MSQQAGTAARVWAIWCPRKKCNCNLENTGGNLREAGIRCREVDYYDMLNPKLRVRAMIRYHDGYSSA